MLAAFALLSPTQRRRAARAMLRGLAALAVCLLALSAFRSGIRSGRGHANGALGPHGGAGPGSRRSAVTLGGATPTISRASTQASTPASTTAADVGEDATYGSYSTGLYDSDYPEAPATPPELPNTTATPPGGYVTAAASGKWPPWASAGPGGGSSQHPSGRPTRVLPVDADVLWMAPFLDHSSFGVEAAGLVLPLAAAEHVAPGRMHLGLLQDRCADEQADGGADPGVHSRLLALRTKPTRPTIVVCHNLPPYMGRPRPRWASCEPCPPPPPARVRYAVGRAMAETDRIPPDWVQALNSLDEVWVPTNASAAVLRSSGVRVPLAVLPPAVDAEALWRQAAGGSTALPPAGAVQVFGPPPDAIAPGGKRGAEPDGGPPGGGSTAAVSRPTKFVSVFKWEARKGWDVLLRAFLREFGPAAATAGRDAGGAAGSSGPAAGVEGMEARTGEYKGSEEASGAVIVPQKTDVEGGPAAAPAGRSAAAGSGRGLLSAAESGSGAAAASGRSGGAAALRPAGPGEAATGSTSQAGDELRGPTGDCSAELTILTKPFLPPKQGPGAPASTLAERIRQWADAELGPGDRATACPRVWLVEGHVSRGQYAGLLAGADAFVLPTRGEGWGLPLTDAMALGLPVIATNWSGPTAYLDEQVGYPLPLRGLVPVPPSEPAWFRGSRWAEPSLTDLRRLLRHVSTPYGRREAAARGAAARERVASRYGPGTTAARVAAELKRIARATSGRAR
ncbi:hypothetical protein HYH03_004688 [Edaphochlamys debaryana]|uniref:Glycosyl transferase family 1 domain-containing protein n=1 Tax=Edaphochlamys debaryana TaxID=47281 RepID=A0A836C2S1_9CHLO|nr:hypothetical protein HYH03_004688 [Edaphochlamys debaryana]|eukprot:KAG2497097.1 hypothetical protein HYH03_004688 [Edaphochlamys debaryana]